MDEDEIVVTNAVRAAVNRANCKLEGHNFDVVVQGNGEPVAVFCGRCGARWVVARP